MKTFTDGCALYAGIIKNQAIDTRSRPEIGPFVPVENEQEALEQIGNCSEELQIIFKKAYAVRANALSLQSSSPALAEKEFLEAANLFSDAGAAIPSAEFETSRAKDAAFFFSNMERAFCLLSTDKSSAIDEAVQIYSDAQKFSPNSVVIYYRYAQALIKLGEIDAAISKYQKAELLLAVDQFVPKDHWLHVLVPRSLGFALWRKNTMLAEDGNRKEDRLTLLLSAYNHTERAHSLGGQKVSIQSRCRSANNALYYAVEYMALYGSLDGEIKRESAEVYLRLLEASVDLATAEVAQLSWLDTLCRAYALFEQTSNAVAAAERIEHVLCGPDRIAEKSNTGGTLSDTSVHPYYATTSHLNEQERDVLDHALWVLKKHGHGPERLGTNDLNPINSLTPIVASPLINYSTLEDAMRYPDPGEGE